MRLHRFFVSSNMNLSDSNPSNIEHESLEQDFEDFEVFEDLFLNEPSATVKNQSNKKIILIEGTIIKSTRDGILKF